MMRLFPLAVLLMVVGLVSAVVACGALGGGPRPAGDAATTGATMVLDLSAAAMRAAPSSTEAEEVTAEEEALPESGATDALGPPASADHEPNGVSAFGGEAEDAADGAQAGATGDAAEDEIVTNPTVTVEAPVEGRTYTVKEGDTPFSIAQSLGTSVDELLQLNGIADPTSLQIGDTLRLPAP